ncbi:MAG: ribonuclease E inhibitor RraB [Pyrinomonadaceae bacterium]
MTKSDLKQYIVGHNHRNRELLTVLESSGLSEESRIDAEYHFWADEQSDAVAFAKRLYDEGYLILVLAPVPDEKNGITWNLEARKREAIKDVISERNTEYLVELANDFNSLYDGWGTVGDRIV